jgi:hypothetical protein
MLSNQRYNVLKHVAAVGLPSLSALYFALAQIWHLPKAEEVMGTVAAVNVFVGAFVGVSGANYNNSDAKYDGVIRVDDSGTTTTASLVLHDDPASILNKPSATFKVSPAQDSPGNPPTLGV